MYVCMYRTDKNHIIYSTDVWKDWGVQLRDFGLTPWDVSGARSLKLWQSCLAIS